MRLATLRAFPLDVIATFSAIAAGIILMATTPSGALEWAGTILFVGGILSALTIIVIETARQHQPAPNTKDQHG